MDAILRYRLHVILLAATSTLLPFPKITWQSGMMALAMGMVMAWVYLFNKVMDVAEDQINVASLPVEKRFTSTLTKIAVACLVIPILWLWQTPGILEVYLIFGGLLGFLYSYPIPIGQRCYRLKNILLINNLTAAISWAACLGMPYYLLHPNSGHTYIIQNFVSVFVMALCLTIICDIRDVDGDRLSGVRTLPNTLGVFATKILTLAIFSFYCLWFYGTFRFVVPSLPLLLAHITTFLIICFASKTRPFWYFHLLAFVYIIYTGVNLISKL